MRKTLNQILTQAIVRAYPSLPSTTISAVNLSKTGDYRDATALRLSKSLKTPPQEIADTIASHISPALFHPSGPFETIKSSDKGFLDITISNLWLSQQMQSIAKNGPNQSNMEDPKSIVVDFGSPNVGKQLHAGHLRSSVIGDSISRILEYQGHNVTRLSHVGDVGMPVALLVAHGLDTNVKWMELPEDRDETDGKVEKDYYKEHNQSNLDRKIENYFDSTPTEETDLPTTEELTKLYVAAKARSTLHLEQDLQEDSDFDMNVLSTLKILQTTTTKQDRWNYRNRKVLYAWHRIKQASRIEHDLQFARLGVNVLEKPESSYTDALDDVVNELLSSKIAIISNRATCVFPLPENDSKKQKALLKRKKKNHNPTKTDDYTPPSEDNYRPPMIIRKGDGSALYATVDLACIRQRLVQDQADHIIYVTDEGQRFHFNQIFNAAKRARWINQESTKRKIQFDSLKLQQHALESKSIKKSKYVNSDVLSNKKKIQKKELKKLKQEILKIKQEFKNSDVSTTNDSILSHVGFGLVKDSVTKNKLSSRDGDALPLSTLLDHATEAAKNALERTEDILIQDYTGRSMLVSEAVGISALRYYDLRAGRKSYGLDFEQMLAFKGNTSVYLQYALTRIKSIQRKINDKEMKTNEKEMNTSEPEMDQEDADGMHVIDVSKEEMTSFPTDIERKLALELMKFEDVVDNASSTLSPHAVCEYLYVIAKTFHAFYEECHVSGSEHEENRMVLLKATEKVLSTGMKLLGVVELERM